MRHKKMEFFQNKTDMEAWADFYATCANIRNISQSNGPQLGWLILRYELIDGFEY